MRASFLLLAISFSLANGAVPIVPKVIQELDPTEPWLGQVFHDDHLWVYPNRWSLPGREKCSDLARG